MSRARKTVWLVIATVMSITGIAGAVAAGSEAPVEAASLGSEVSDAADDGAPENAKTDAVRTTTTRPATTTTAPTTTTVPPTTAPTTTPPTTTPPTTAPPTTAAPPPPTTAAPPAPSGPQHGTRNTGCEQFMYNQINAARADAGRAALAFDRGIQYIAVSWSDGMAGRQILAHNPDYANQILRHRDYRHAGENVGRGYEQGSLFQAFMNSPGHRQNIESGSYTQVTVGCLTDGNGQLWVTQNFWS